MSKLIRYTVVPQPLFRFQTGNVIKLRDYATQVAKGSRSYDLKLHNQLVLPMEGDTFHTPNGMSLRPSTPKMHSLLSQFVGASPNVFCLMEGLQIPEGLVLIHEHTDHFSLQTAVPIPLAELNKKLTDFMATWPVQSREDFFRQLNDPDDQDN